MTAVRKVMHVYRNKGLLKLTRAPQHLRGKDWWRGGEEAACTCIICNSIEYSDYRNAVSALDHQRMEKHDKKLRKAQL